jgi:nucleotide-binding universal stress UspA family protein
MAPIHTILYPTDFSEPSDYAFHLACAVARDYGARVIALHVEQLPVFAYGEGMVPPDPEGLQAAARGRLDQLAPYPTVRVEQWLEEGDPIEVILEVAKEVNADLIVMGTHGRKGLARILLGSVAEQVGRQAPCPVLTVRTPFAEAETVASGPLAEAAHG